MSSNSSNNEAVDGEIVSESSADLSSSQTETNASSTNEASPEKSHELKTRLLSPEHWLRGLFMLLFVTIACVASYVMFVLVIIQFVFALITGSSEERLQAFGGQLSQYLYQILRFITYNDEQKPFPFSDWPNDNSTTGNE